MNTPYTARTPDIILYNGSTGNNLSVKSLAVLNGRIVATGSNDQVRELAGRGTVSIDLEGRLVLPGFIDTHIHFHEWALKRRELQLSQITSLEELLACVAREVSVRDRGQWVTGQGWNETDWQERRMPTREILDSVAPDNPVVLWRCDLHLAVANSAALKKAHIQAGTPDPPQGRIERDESGEPNGILRELAINLIRDVIDPPKTDQVAIAYKEATDVLYRLGITGIHDIRLMDDNDGGSALQTFQELDSSKQLGLRSWVTLPGHRLDDIINLGIRTGFGNDRLRIGHVKFFTDGGVGARTAWMVDPYLDADRGMPLIDMSELADEIQKADAAGLSVMVHAIGDRANREVITIFERLYEQKHKCNSVNLCYPHRIEHLQVIRPEDVNRLGKMPLALGVTPANMLLDINLIDTALGDQGAWAYSFRRLMDTGLPVMFSSDCPVCDPDPLLGIHAAVTRQRQDGTPLAGWYPESRVMVSEAVKAYTSVPAMVHGAKDLGSIALNSRADLAVFSRDFLSTQPDDILKSQVDMTLFDGKIVYRNF
ncbi:amidohydrolase [Desulfopila sp. IMCC35008]|uniref:amidohydrolase n=1 Tax=Desulfopila sp. IMCC35008 TaxID=2653858 RepID=UPI0013CF9F4C|nr:amidohydrolase [Desulfopila sp. IMCC35008]